MIKVRVPATSANLGPGFDCLGLALDIWNEVSFEEANELRYHCEGEGVEKLNKGNRNLLTKAYARLFEACGQKMSGFHIFAYNKIPMSSGLGSSAAAIVAGLFGANEILGKPLAPGDLLKLAAEMEGHPDNVAPALLGGLVVSVTKQTEIITRRYDIPALATVIVKPAVDWLTKTARAVLPKSVSQADAIHNIGRTALVVDALRNGDLVLLQQVMEDRIHQMYRLRHIRAGTAAYKCAKRFGAAALSGAGPSLIIFTQASAAEQTKSEVQSVFEAHGIPARGFITSPSNIGVHTI